jgi:hypothetical protein
MLLHHVAVMLPLCVPPSDAGISSDTLLLLLLVLLWHAHSNAARRA